LELRPVSRELAPIKHCKWGEAKRVSYGETKYQGVYAVIIQTNIFFFVCKSCKIDGSLLLLNWANLERSPGLGSSLLGLLCLFSPHESITEDN
jgi:hypothetical protein